MSRIKGYSLFDIRAGKGAGTKTIAVCTGSFSAQDHQKQQPNLILPQIKDLLPQIPLMF